MFIDYSESRLSVKGSDLSNTCALIIRKLPLFERLNCIYYEPIALRRLNLKPQFGPDIWRGRVIYRIVFAQLGVKEPKS